MGRLIYVFTITQQDMDISLIPHNKWPIILYLTKRANIVFFSFRRESII